MKIFVQFHPLLTYFILAFIMNRDVIAWALFAVNVNKPWGFDFSKSIRYRRFPCGLTQ